MLQDVEDDAPCQQMKYLALATGCQDQGIKKSVGEKVKIHCNLSFQPILMILIQNIHNDE